MICQPFDISPVFGSILMATTTPLYSVAYLSIGATVPLGIGMEKRDAIIEYSVFGVTNAEPWFPETFGTGPKICFVLKSLRSIRATRGVHLVHEEPPAVVVAVRL